MIFPVRIDQKKNENKNQWDIAKPLDRADLAMMQMNDSWSHNLIRIYESHEFMSHNYDLYDSIRANIPIIEACYRKYEMLIGMPEFNFGGNKKVQKVVSDFIERVRVNYLDYGLQNWLIQMVDSALHYGNGFGELIPTRRFDGVAMIKNVSAKNIRFLTKENGELAIGQYSSEGLKVIPFDRMEFIYHLAIWKRDGHPQGYGMLFNLPFMTKLFNYVTISMMKNWVRSGDPTFAFFIETDKDAINSSNFIASRESIAQLEAKWQQVMRDRMQGRYRDITGAPPPGSKIVIKTIGEGVTMPDFEVSMRTIIEEIVAQTGFPLFFFGFHWGGNYNLTTHQNDMIVNQINYIRSCINPLIDRMIHQLMLLNGFTDVRYDWQWPEVNLRDEVEQAKAAADRASALATKLKAMLDAYSVGLCSEQAIVNFLIGEGIEDESFIKTLGSEKFFDLMRKRYMLATSIDMLENLHLHGGFKKVTATRRSP